MGDHRLNRPPPAWDRFAHWPRSRARWALGALLLMLLAAWAVPLMPSQGEHSADVPAAQSSAAPIHRERNPDLALYNTIIERLRDGESYYVAAVEEHRRQDYPLQPGLAVRLPTLAYLLATIPPPWQNVLAAMLVLATLAAWWVKLGEEPGGRSFRLLAIAFLVVGLAVHLNSFYFPVHDLWVGPLLALSLGLHRPGRWAASLAAAALALSIRELALPFVLLMAATAFWRRDVKEGSAWSLLAIAFVVAMWFHMGAVAALTDPADRVSPPWLVLGGATSWLSKIVMSSNLQYLPLGLGAPMVVLMIAGLAGWRSPAGAFGTLLFLGYGAAFMFAGRPNNFYWGLNIAPVMFIGLAFAPRSVSSLWAAAGLPGQRREPMDRNPAAMALPQGEAL